MKFNKSSGGEFPLQPSGTHLAVLYQIIHLGTQEIKYQNQTKPVDQVRLVFELHGEECQLPDGKPMAISKTFSKSGHEKSGLRLFMEKWRGKKFSDEELEAFDFRTMLGKACLMTIVHKESENGTFANIDGATRLMAGMTAPTPKNELLFVSLEDGEYDPKAFNKLSEKVKEKIWKSPQYMAIQGLSAPSDVLPANDDFPFDGE